MTANTSAGSDTPSGTWHRMPSPGKASRAIWPHQKHEFSPNAAAPELRASHGAPGLARKPPGHSGTSSRCHVRGQSRRFPRGHEPARHVRAAGTKKHHQCHLDLRKSGGNRRQTKVGSKPTGFRIVKTHMHPEHIEYPNYSCFSFLLITKVLVSVAMQSTWC